MKLIIDIPERDYKNVSRIVDMGFATNVDEAIKNGTPLDVVKAEIAEEICLTDNPYTKETKYTIEHLKLLEILDNIGKESEEYGKENE